MSVSFCGTRKDPSADYGVVSVRLHYEDGEERYLNLSNMNARAFLDFLGLEAGESLYGSVDLPTLRRAIMRARATFARKVGGYVRADEASGGEGRCRVYSQGIDSDYFARRLDELSSFVEDLAKAGADAVTWG